MEFQPMPFEEMQRTMQFLLDNGARVDARLDKLSEKTDRIADGLIGLTGIVGRIAQRQEELTRLQEDLTREQKDMAKEMDRRTKKLDDQISATDSHLSVVIEMFERRLREDHGHRPS